MIEMCGHALDRVVAVCELAVEVSSGAIESRRPGRVRAPTRRRSAFADDRRSRLKGALCRGDERHPRRPVTIGAASARQITRCIGRPVTVVSRPNGNRRAIIAVWRSTSGRSVAPDPRDRECGPSSPRAGYGARASSSRRSARNDRARTASQPARWRRSGRGPP